MGTGSGVLTRYSAAAGTRWRNGAGLTRELHASAGWRLSAATVPEPAEFSLFAGRDRTLVVAGGRLGLAVGGGGQRWLGPGDLLEFPGEARVVATPAGGPVLAVNVMADRAHCAAAVRVIRLDGAAPAADALVLLAGAAVAHGEQMAPLDAVVGVQAGAVRSSGGLAVVVEIVEGQP
ncbi:HutD family protein [Blastococcus sp. SYSU DS0669]